MATLCGQNAVFFVCVKAGGKLSNHLRHIQRNGRKLDHRKRHCYGMRDFDVSKALKISVVVFWIVTPFSLISG
jgi:hypothetical protein